MATKKKVGKGRPKINIPKQYIGVKIDKDLYKIIKIHCVNSERGLAFVINEALGAYFKGTTQQHIENKKSIFIGDESKQED